MKQFINIITIKIERINDSDVDSVGGWINWFSICNDSNH